MTTQTLQIRRRTNDTIDIDYYRAEALRLRNQHTANLTRGGRVTIWALIASGALMLAVIAFAPRNAVTPGVASNGHPIAVAFKAR
jgi:hypothetical protein